MNSNNSGQAAVLTSKELDLLIQELPSGTHTVLATVLRKTAGRVSEARQLTWGCITSRGIKFPKSTVKRKLKTREIPLTPQNHPELHHLLKEWRIKWQEIQGREATALDWVFPGRDPDHCLTKQAFDKALRSTAKKLNLENVSTHTFRRSALTAASSAAIPLRHIQAISGHASLQVLQKYLEVSPEEKEKAACSFA